VTHSKKISFYPYAVSFSLLLTIAGVFFSHALASLSLVLFCLLTIPRSKPIFLWNSFVKSPLLIGLSVLLFIPFISLAWSADLQHGGQVVLNKLPFLLLPFAFLASWHLPNNHIRVVILFLFILLFFTSLYSLLPFFNDSFATTQAYLKAATLPVPMGNDHVRYSYLMLLCIIAAPVLYPYLPSRIWRIAFIAFIAWFIIFLHLLAVRTGLLGLYIFGIVFCIQYLSKNFLKKRILIIVAVLTLLPLSAWLAFPTLQNRVKYVKYDVENVLRGNYLPGANDGNRLRSILAGWQIAKENPAGVGAGDVWTELKKIYTVQHPDMPESDKIYIHSEPLIYAAFAGWLGISAFFLCMFLPFTQKEVRQSYSWSAFLAISALSYLFDTTLEVQNGIYIFSFFYCFYWKNSTLRISQN